VREKRTFFCWEEGGGDQDGQMRESASHPNAMRGGLFYSIYERKKDIKRVLRRMRKKRKTIAKLLALGKEREILNRLRTGKGTGTAAYSERALKKKESQHPLELRKGIRGGRTSPTTYKGEEKAGDEA